MLSSSSLDISRSTRDVDESTGAVKLPGRTRRRWEPDRLGLSDGGTAARPSAGQDANLELYTELLQWDTLHHSHAVR